MLIYRYHVSEEGSLKRGSEKDGEALLPTASPYFSPNELAKRWRCSRSSVDRIARRAKLKRLCLGDGKNASIRYLIKEVLNYEATRLV
jgi:hypothetical protein